MSVIFRNLKERDILFQDSFTSYGAMYTYVGMARNRAQYKDHKSSYLKIEIKTIFDMIIV